MALTLALSFAMTRNDLERVTKAVREASWQHPLHVSQTCLCGVYLALWH